MFRRNLWTGELEEVQGSGEGSSIIYREEIPSHLQQRRQGTPWGRSWETETLSVPNEQAADFNEASRKHGTGAYYRPNPNTGYATLVCDSRRSRAREIKLRGKVDGDGGYGDG